MNAITHNPALGSKSDLAGSLMRRLEKLRAERGTIESQWQEIGELIKPLRADFTLKRSMGEKRMQKVFDSTPGMAAHNLAAGLYGNISSPSNDWFDLAHEDDDLNEDFEVSTWLSIAAKRMRKAFAANGGRFYSKIMPLYGDLVGFGTSVFYMEPIPGRGAVFYSHRHLAECYLAQNAYEEIDTIFRVFRLAGRAAAQHEDWDLPEGIRKTLDKEPDREWEFVHVVIPNEDFKAGMIGPRGMRFASIWIACEQKHVMKVGGYKRFPYQSPRWSMPSVGAYGDSQAMLALPDVKMLNAFRKVGLVGAQKTIDPTVLAMDEQALGNWVTTPGGVVYGGLDDNGNPRFRPYMTGGQPQLSFEYEQQIRDSVREAFHASLMLMVAKPGATATEVLAQQEEKLRLMGPNLGMVQAEFLDPVIDWQFAEMLEAGAFPPLPQALLDYPAINVEYVSPLARAQKAGEGAAIVRTLDALAPLAANDPSILDNIDSDATARAIAAAFGAPMKILRDPKAVEAIRGTRAQKEDVASMMAAAQPVSGAMKNLAQAQQAMTAARDGGAGGAGMAA